MHIAKRQLFFWLPRILSILFLLLLATFSLDVFDEHLGFWDTLLGLFMHNLPVLVLTIVLAIAWKRELVGTIFFALAGLAYIVSVLTGNLHGNFKPYMLSWMLIISGPAFIIAAFFYVGWQRKKTPSAKN